MAKLMHQSSGLLLKCTDASSKPSHRNMKIVSGKFSASRAGLVGIRRIVSLQMREQRIMEGETSRVIRSKIGGIGFYCVETSDARAGGKTQAGDVEKTLVRNRITDIDMQCYSAAAVRIVDCGIRKRPNHRVDDSGIWPVRVRVAGKAITSRDGAVHKIYFKKYVFAIWTGALTGVSSIAVAV